MVVGPRRPGAPARRQPTVRRSGPDRAGAAGDEVCLFADRDNPVSLRLYARLGFEPVTDTVDLLLDS